MDIEESRLIRFTNLAGGALKSIQALKGMKMAPYGMSAAHTDLLCHLAHRPEGATQTELAALEMIDKAQVSRVLRALEGKGLIEKDGGGAYRRKYRLTKEGGAVTEELETVILRINRCVSGDIPPGELEAFYRTLTVIAENLSRAERLMAEGNEETLYAK